jgi:predicted nucleic acid-binding protein
MIVLDTNVISEAMKPAPNPAVRAWLNQQVAETLYLTSVTLAEMLFGIAVLPAGRRRNSLSRALDGLLELFGDRVLPFDIAAARHYMVLAVAVTGHGTLRGRWASGRRSVAKLNTTRRASQGTGTPMDLSRAWARPARAFRPSR